MGSMDRLERDDIRFRLPLQNDVYKLSVLNQIFQYLCCFKAQDVKCKRQRGNKK